MCQFVAERVQSAKWPKWSGSVANSFYTVASSPVNLLWFHMDHILCGIQTASSVRPSICQVMMHADIRQLSVSPRDTHTHTHIATNECATINKSNQNPG